MLASINYGLKVVDNFKGFPSINCEAVEIVQIVSCGEEGFSDTIKEESSVVTIDQIDDGLIDLWF